MVGLPGDRYVVACNGRRVPLCATDTPASMSPRPLSGLAASQRLHPTIPIDTPLVFDLYDTWNGRSLAGARTTSRIPGRLSYRAFPVNAMEAESRRTNRFFGHGHTAGVLAAAGGDQPRVPAHARPAARPLTILRCRLCPIRRAELAVACVRPKAGARPGAY